MRVQTISEAGNKVREIFEDGLNGTTYFILELEGKEYQIRVSDHSANALNNTRYFDGMFSFTSNYNHQHCNMNNEYILDEGGNFTEQFMDVEDCLECSI